MDPTTTWATGPRRRGRWGRLPRDGRGRRLPGPGGSLAVERGLPFVCIRPGPGTISPSTWGSTATTPPAISAFNDAVERRVDYATVNDRLFVNNVSLGVYATIVQQEGYRDAKAETTQELLPDLLGSQPTPSTSSSPRPTGPRSTGPSSSWCRTTPTS